MEKMVCRKCGEERDISAFPIRSGTDKRRSECNLCFNAYQRERYREALGGKHKREVRADNREADPKRCIKCGEIKPLSEFKFHNREKGQHRNFCHLCEKEWTSAYHKSEKGKVSRQEWMNENQDKIRQYRDFYKNSPEHRTRSKEYQKRRRLMEDYGLTLEQYNEMLATQGGVCAICKNGRPDVSGRTVMFRVDHDHTTGRIRGLLCHSCNVSIGMMKDSPVLLRLAAEYLERFK